MTNTHTLRPGLTAIAAVLTFSSIPLLAQVATPTTTAPAPVAADPVPVTVTSTTVAPTVDPIASPADPIAATTGATAEKAVTKSVKRTTVTRTSAKAAPVAKASTTSRAERVTSATKPAATAASVAAPVAMVPTQAPAPQALAPTPVPPVEPLAAAPVTEATPAALPADETLPIVGAGLGALALAAGGLALGRRRRRCADEEVMSDATYVEPAMTTPAPVEAAPQPRFAQTAAIMPAVAVHRPAGQHSARVAAAYAGPSEDNPSLSMKKRIKRAHALDQMERNGRVVPKPEPIRVAAPRQPSVSTWAKPVADGLMFGRDPALKPAFQH